MRRMMDTTTQLRRHVAPLTIAAVLAVVATGATARQDGPLPATPAAAECTVTPMSLPLQHGSQLAEPTSPVSVDGPFVIPSGMPVDNPTRVAVTMTIMQAIACENAGDVPRMLALFTPERAERFFSGPRGFDADAVEATAEAGASPVSADRQIALLAIGDPEMLSDGRVGATVRTAVGQTEYEDYLFLADAGDGRWLIDGSVALNDQTQVDQPQHDIP